MQIFTSVDQINGDALIEELQNILEIPDVQEVLQGLYELQRGVYHDMMVCGRVTEEQEYVLVTILEAIVCIYRDYH